MRILAVHPGITFSVADVHNGWTRAFENLGCEVVNYNLDDRLGFYMSVKLETDEKLNQDDATMLASAGLEAACWRYQPDVVFVTSGFFIPDRIWDGWHSHGIRTVLLLTESPYEDDRQAGLVRRIEPTITLLNDPSRLTDFRDGKRRVYYMPHSYDPTVHYDDNQDRDRDFTFVGTGYPSRIEFFDAVDWDGIGVELAGNWRGLPELHPLQRFIDGPAESCTDNQDTADLYRRTKVSANLYRGLREANRTDLAQGWAVGPREIELAACGTFFLREPRGEGDLLFPMLPTFSDPAGFGDLLRWYLEHDEIREKNAALARAAVADRTFDTHARRLLRLLQ